MATVKIGWSGGKDSTCATHLHLLQGDECIVCNYIPMFDDEIPLILKDHYNFIMETADKFRSMGAVVHIVHGMTYWDFCHYRARAGKRTGEIFGFPFFMRGKCNFQRDSKTKAISELDKKFGLQYDYVDLGIAYDETDRHGQLNEQTRSILVEKKYSEQMAKEYCIKHGIYSPHYSDFKRDGCVLCSNARREERIRWYQDYPEAFERVIALQEFVKENRPNQYPLRDYKMFIEESNQLSLFEEQKYIIN